MSDIRWSLSPNPAELIKALAEGMSYRLDAALADLIDNSISAGATEVALDVFGSSVDTAILTIFDNGWGMTQSELMHAVQFGEMSKHRKAGDLGRFGLGMKTASLSVCRVVTILSKSHGQLDGVTIDIDNLSPDAIVAPLSAEEVANVSQAGRLSSVPSGTLIIWRHLKAFQTIDALNAGVVEAARELALTFHRYLHPEAKESRLSITLGGSRLIHRDPFLKTHNQTENLRTANVDLGKGVVARLSGNILPPIRRMTQDEQVQATGGKTFLETSGVYVYRSRRLIQYGDWLGIIPRRKMIGLARVALDLDQNADQMLSVDVTKTRLRLPLPEPLFSRLTDYIEPIKRRATSAFLNEPRNQRIDRAESQIWIRLAEMNEIRYYINDNHPLISEMTRLGTSPDALDRLLRAVEYALPVARIFTDMQGLGTQAVLTGESASNKLEDFRGMAIAILAALSPMLSRAEIINRIPHIQPFQGDPETTNKVLLELAEELS